jgi:L-arabinose isomerase
MIKIGLLPLYVKLYDDVWPNLRASVDSFYQTIAGEFENRGVFVLRSPVCRVQSEFKNALAEFEKNDADAVVTLHLAYSPSLESIVPLAKTKLPIVVLDTTEAFDFAGSEDPYKISYNHGIHGVQDMCNLLLRNGKKFFIEAGHWQGSNVIDRVNERVRGLKIAKGIRNAKVGRVGGFFAGMGDFAVPVQNLEEQIGITTESFDASYVSLITDEEIDAEIRYDKEKFNIDNVDDETHRNATKAGLAIRKWVKEKGLTAMTANFMEITKSSGLICMPFAECCKLMANGIGYAGEGDVLTAALTGALLSLYPDTTFAEMFCPDWKNNTIFFSHMGEINPNILAGKPRILKKEFVFTDADDTIFICGKMKKGNGVLVNIAPSYNNTYTLIAAEMTVGDTPSEGVAVRNNLGGYLSPKGDIARFLENYSKAGGTHHSAFVYGDVLSSITTFGEAMGWNVIKL